MIVIPPEVCGGLTRPLSRGVDGVVVDDPDAPGAGLPVRGAEPGGREMTAGGCATPPPAGGADAFGPEDGVDGWLELEPPAMMIGWRVDGLTRV